jgi:hypothetical protein
LGFFLLTGYHTLLSTYSAIFGIVVLLMIITYLYVNEKIFVGLLSIVAFLFIARTLNYYYTLFVTFMVITLFISQKKKKVGIIEGYLHKRKDVLAILVSLLVALLVIIIYASHVNYSKGFDMSVSNQSLYYNRTSNQTMYIGHLSYSDISGNYVYIMFFGASGDSFSKIGIANQSVIASSLKCASGNVSCLVNVNRITLLNKTGNYTIRAYFGKSNVTGAVYDARLYVYYGNYFYAADSVSNTIR